MFCGGGWERVSGFGQPMCSGQLCVAGAHCGRSMRRVVAMVVSHRWGGRGRGPLAGGLPLMRKRRGHLEPSVLASGQAASILPTSASALLSLKSSLPRRLRSFPPQAYGSSGPKIFKAPSSVP